jgi:acetolactate synthase small subunit
MKKHCINKLLIFGLLFGGLFGQEGTEAPPTDSVSLITLPETTGVDTTDTTTAVSDTLEPLPPIRELKDQPEFLPPGEPFFKLKSDFEQMQRQIDSLKKVIKVYEKNKGLPTLDQELLDLIKIPQLQHRIELTNGTVVMGEIIDQNDLRIIVQTSIGQLAIDRDKIEKITEELPPRAKVEIIGNPVVAVFSDHEEISGVVKNTGKKRADFVRVIANLWTASTELGGQDSVFINGSMQKFKTGIISDTSLEPSATANFKLSVPLDSGEVTSYRTYDVHWEESN